MANGLMTMGVMDESRQSRSSFVVSAVLNSLWLLLFFYFGVQKYVIRLPVRTTEAVSYLVAAVPATPAAKVPVLKVSVMRSAVQPALREPALRAPVLAPEPRPAMVPLVAMAAAPRPALDVPLPSVAVVHPPEVKVGTFGSAKPVEATDRRVAAGPGTAGFGAAVASNQPASNRSVVGTGFGTVAVSAPGRKQTVASSGFGSNIAEPESAVRSTAAVETVPPTVTFVPHPNYTAEAKARHVEGEVAVKVVLLASGEVRVLGVVQSLDAGLDKEALAVAGRIKFNPAMRDHVPVDFTSVVHIKFQLS